MQDRDFQKTDSVAAQVIFVAGDVGLCVRDGVNQPGGVIGQRGAVVERIGDLRELPLAVISKVRYAGCRRRVRLGRGYGEQVAIGVIDIGGDIAQRIGHSKRLAKAVVCVGSGYGRAGVQMGRGV